MIKKKMIDKDKNIDHDTHIFIRFFTGLGTLRRRVIIRTVHTPKLQL